MAGENQAVAAALKGWKAYFNNVTVAGRRNVSNLCRSACDCAWAAL